MNQREAYAKGRDNGEDAAEYVELPWTAAQANATSWKLEEVLEETWSQSSRRLPAPPGWARNRLYVGRSPGFINFASEMNKAQPDWRREALWEKYEEGLSVGIRKGLREQGYDLEPTAEEEDRSEVPYDHRHLLLTRHRRLKAPRTHYMQDVWYQIDGDLDAAKYGATIARFDGSGVELREIQSVREHVGDREAAEVGYPFWSNEAYFDEDELSGSSRAEKLERLEEKIEDLAVEGKIPWEPGPSGWAADVLPVPGAQASRIHWWTPQGHGFREEEAEFRREILNT